MIVGLWETLQRRLRKGHPEKVKAPFSEAVRVAVTFDIATVLFGEVAQRTLSPHRLLGQVLVDMTRQVFDGFVPRGKYREELERTNFTGQVDPWADARARILDAGTDLAALDALCVLLRHLKDAADGQRARWSEGPPMEAREMLVRVPGLQIAEDVDELIRDVNQRLRDAGVGYQYHHPRFDMAPEPALDKDIVEPALAVLSRHQCFADTDREYGAALAAWKRHDFKQTVHHCGEALEGMLRVLVQELRPEKHRPGLQVAASVDLLNSLNLWRGPHDTIMKKVAALRGDLGAHSEATKPREARANERDAASLVFLTGTMLVYLGMVYEDHKLHGRR